VFHISAVRRAFAESLGVRNPAVVDAFATVPREHFIPGAPLQDVAVPLDPARMLNSGHPSVLAQWIDAAAPQRGEAVLHVGAGVGYYTAILAELAGRVLAYEVDAGLAARAKELLSDWQNVQVEAGDAAAPPGRFDVIFINAGVTHPLPSWLGALNEGGRMLLPLTAHPPGVTRHGIGVMARLERRGTRWPFSVVSPCGIYDCAGARDAALEAELRPLVLNGAEAIRAVETAPHARGDSCVFHAPGFCLQCQRRPLSPPSGRGTG
jgi:protein-L-isoaspartate(D-aspartate) O-methyltransferase